MITPPDVYVDFDLIVNGRYTTAPVKHATKLLSHMDKVVVGDHEGNRAVAVVNAIEDGVILLRVYMGTFIPGAVE